MFALPDILPADPRAPEHVSHRTMALEYGPLARFVFRIASLRLIAPDFAVPSLRPTAKQQHATI